MDIKEIIEATQKAVSGTITNLLNAKLTAEYNSGETLLKFDGDTVFILGSN